MDISAVLRMLRGASEKMDPRAGMANLALRASAPGGVHPITKQRYLPNFEPRPEDIYSELEAMTKVPPPPKAPEVDPFARQLDLFGPKENYTDLELDMQNRLMSRPEQGFSPAAAADAPFPMARELPERPLPTPPPPNHGFEFADYQEGNPYLTIDGLTYGDSRTPQERALADVRFGAEDSMEGNLAAQTKLSEMLEGAKRWQDVPRSEIVDSIQGMSTARPPAALSSYLKGVRRAEFGAIPTRTRDRIIGDMEQQRVFATDNPTSGNAGGEPSLALREAVRAEENPVRRVGGWNSPYPELLEALQAGAIRGSFMEELPQGWAPGATVPLRLNETTTTPVRIRAIHGYDPQADRLTRTKLLSMIGRGAQDLGRFKKGSVVEFEITDSAVVPKLTPEMEVGNVVPISRPNGAVHQMEIIGIKDLKDGQKKLMLRAISGETPEESRASALLALDARAKSVDKDSEAVDLLKWMAQPVAHLFKNSAIVQKPGTLNVGLGPKPKGPQLPAVSLAGKPDFEKAQSYGVYTKRDKADKRAIYYGGARAVPLDRTYRSWVVVQTGTDRYRMKPGTQGAEILQIDDAGFVTRVKINPDGSWGAVYKDKGSDQLDRRTIESIFPPNVQERIVPFLDRGKYRTAQKSREAWKAKQQGRPPAGQAGKNLDQGKSELDKILDTLKKPTGRYQKATAKPVEGVQYDSEGIGRSPEGIEYVPAAGAPRGAAEERLKTTVIRKLGKTKSPDPEGPDSPEIDAIIAKIDNGEPLGRADLALVESVLPQDLFTAFFEDMQKPRLVRGGTTGPAKYSMPGMGPREIEQESRSITKRLETKNPDRSVQKLEFRQQANTQKKSTFRGKPTKEGLVEARPVTPSKIKGLTIVDQITAEQVNKNPQAIFLTTTPQKGMDNLIDARSENLDKLITGAETVVISKATIAKLTPQQREAVRAAIKGRFGK